MTENLQTDPFGINEFILNAALNKEPVFEAYKKLCEIQKNQKIDYVDFEWKYYQFYHGNRDLTIEKSRDNSSPVTFSDLPIDVHEKVMGKLPLVERLVIRKVSPYLRNLVDSMKVYYPSVAFVFGRRASRIDFRNIVRGINFESTIACVKYRQVGNGDCEVAADRNPVKTFKNSNFVKIMVADALTFLKNPKLKIELLKFDVYNEGVFLEFLEVLKSLDFQLNVLAFYFETKRNFFLPTFQFLKPKTLKWIFLDPKIVTIDQCNEIAETEQWKMAQRLCCYRFPGGFRMEKMLHFMEIRLHRFEFDEENLIMVRDILFKSAHLKLCSLGQFHYREELVNDFGDRPGDFSQNKSVVRIMGEDPAYDPETRRFSIPASRDYFQLDFEDSLIKFTLTISRISQNE